MILMYRIIQGLLELTYPYLLLDRDTFPTTRGHQYKVFKVHYNARANFFTCGIANMWNDKLLKLHH